MAKDDEYEVFAIRYATRQAGRPEHFIGGDPHDTEMPMDYFVWLIRNEHRCYVVDTGFSAETGARRKRQVLRSPAEGLALLGVDAATVKDVIITHLHYDHAGTFGDFPAADFHLQDLEMSFATGRHMSEQFIRHSYEVEDVVQMVRMVYGERVKFHSGESQLAPGLSVHHIGGHTAGIQCVRVNTARGWVVLASDASHYYEHFRKRRVFTIAFNIGDMLQGYSTLERLADSDDHIIPGHDPLVMQHYPAVSDALEGIAVRLDVEPRPL